MGTNIGKWRKPSAPPLDAGTYTARCTGVIDIGWQITSYKGQEKEQPQIILIFEFPTETIEVDGELKPRWMSQIYTKSTYEKAKLRQHLKAWRGQDFTKEELEDFDIARVLNVPCTITVSHTEKDGNIYANIESIGKKMKDVPMPADVIRQFHFDIDNAETWGCFPDLPEWIQAKINGSEDFKLRGVQIDKNGNRVEVASGKSADNGSQINNEVIDGYEVIDDDLDLPF